MPTGLEITAPFSVSPQRRDGECYPPRERRGEALGPCRGRAGGGSTAPFCASFQRSQGQAAAYF